MVFVPQSKYSGTFKDARPSGRVFSTRCLAVLCCSSIKTNWESMAMKSAVLAAGLLLGIAQAITTEGMLAAPRRSTAILSAKGVRIQDLATDIEY
jgi:hypothetical protein